MPFLFTNPALLAALAALGLPVLIHLLLKPKKQRLRFSTLRFFEQQDEHSSQRRKLRNLLLLTVRLLLLAVLVLAFARPYLPNSNAPGSNQKRRLAVLIMDRSASMQAVEAGVPRWARAKQSAQKILAELKPDDRAALVSCAAHCEVLSGAAPAEASVRLLKDLPPTAASGNVAEALRLASKIASSAGSDALATIYVISDLQSASCKGLNSYPLPAAVELKVLPTGDIMIPNVAVTELQLENRTDSKPHVVFANFSDESSRRVKWKLLLDGKEVLSRDLEFSTGNVVRTELVLPRLTAGWHSGAMRVDTDDALVLDNVRYEAFFVPQPIRTLVAETRSGKRIFEEESFFLTSALDPMQDSTNAIASPFSVEKCASEELVKKLSGVAEQLNYDLLLLPGLAKFPSGLPTALVEFAKKGGSVIFFLNDDVNPGKYNGELSDLLPGQLGHIDRGPSPDTKWHLDEYEPNAPMFVPFRRPGSGNLALPEFTRRFTLSPNPGAAVVAKFEDEVPAIVTWNVGRGKVLLVNTSADTAWTDWPKHKTFVPWLHSLSASMASRSIAEQPPVAPRLIAGEEKDIPLGGTAKNQTFRLQRPGEKDMPLTADADGILRNIDCGKPGIYTIADGTGHELQRLAVNMPAEESDLAALTPNDFQRQFVHAADPRGSALAAGFFGEEIRQKEFARLLLIAGLGLLFLETFLANRTYA